MRLYDAVQWLIVAGVVTVSALYVFGRFMPQWRAQLALHLQQPRYAPWINQLGARIAGAGGCGECDSCGRCAGAAKKK